MAKADGTDHDALYHRLFGHPGVVAQLLREFVAGPWLDGLDLDAMERLNAKFHAEAGRRREGDMIWRIPRQGGGASYLILLLEFQSTSDAYMALRVLAYAALLWQQLVAEGRLVADGMLPPVLPVVLYNGEPRWRAPVTVRELVSLPQSSPLWRWQPELRYHVIDAGSFSDADLAARESLPALWFRLEGASDTPAVVAVADAVLAWLARNPGYAAARRVIAELLSATMAPLGPDIRVPQDLLEVRNMLATRVEQWVENWKREGLEKGRQEGLQQGLQQGLRQGLRDGQREGHQQGEATLLLRLLERRFGTLPSSVADRVRAAGIAELEEWALRLLDAVSLAEVFADRAT